MYSVLGDRKSVKELAGIYEKIYGVKPQIQQKGSLGDLYSRMQSTYKDQSENEFAWIGMFYQYYMQNGTTWLRKLDNERYPTVLPLTAEGFLQEHTKETVAKSFFLI